MTEHSKTPVPAESKSLIERAVRSFDLNSLAPPPVPKDLAAAPLKPSLRHGAPAALQASEAQAVAPPPVPGPPVAPPVVAQSVPVAAEPVAARPPAPAANTPVVF